MLSKKIIFLTGISVFAKERVNYKMTHSIVLMAVCDAQYKFTLVDIGDSGRQNDGSVCANSNLGYAIENHLLDTPPDSKIAGSNRVLPYMFVGDDAFGLKRHMMKQHPFSNLSESKLVLIIGSVVQEESLKIRLVSLPVAFVCSIGQLLQKFIKLLL